MFTLPQKENSIIISISMTQSRDDMESDSCISYIGHSTPSPSTSSKIKYFLSVAPSQQGMACEWRLRTGLTLIPLSSLRFRLPDDQIISQHPGYLIIAHLPISCGVTLIRSRVSASTSLQFPVDISLLPIMTPAMELRGPNYYIDAGDLQRQVHGHRCALSSPLPNQRPDSSTANGSIVVVII
ncbi:hypothetical protein J6590_002078 [Homalodisca vitripennis]|nr:hypothetical protein J6590_002078 [Homalodisca vitripennis]